MSASSFFIEKLLIPATIATLTVVITIGYQQYSGTSNLTLFIVEQSIIVESVDGISELDIIYNGKKVKKLSKEKTMYKTLSIHETHSYSLPLFLKVLLLKYNQ